MRNHRNLFRSALVISLLASPIGSALPALSQQTSAYDYISSSGPEEFADAAAVTDALKARLQANDFDGTAKLLGLDAAKLATAEDIKETFETIRQRAVELFNVQEDGEQRIVVLGDEVWPFPFPVRQSDEGKWGFDTEAGIDEIINRRVGENELEAVKTAYGYVEAQKEYAAEDRDDDGVLEYAQKLISSEGQTDGLYWPIEQGDGESPAGGQVSEQQLQKARSSGDGYFGYRFRILRGQGNNVAGGRHDYVINDNMIAGFGLIAWPVTYAETGVHTFVVNHAGIVYEKDLGANTQAAVREIARFNPDSTWEVVKD